LFVVVKYDDAVARAGKRMIALKECEEELLREGRGGLMALKC